MLFHTTWEFHPSNSEEAIQRNLAFFSQWKPPDGFEFKGFWGFADGSGGVAGCDSAPPRSFQSRRRLQLLAKPRRRALLSAARSD